MSKPEGLFYYPLSDIFDSTPIEEWASREKENAFPVGKGKNSRVVLQYGRAYNYKAGGGKIGEKIAKIPEEFAALLDIVKSLYPQFSDDIKKINQAIVNFYGPGQGIGAHIDDKKFGDVIVCFTFGGGREMTFTYKDEKYSLYTHPNSVYIMSEESRKVWKHQMIGRKSDIVDGKRICREECFSITFRSV